MLYSAISDYTYTGFLDSKDRLRREVGIGLEQMHKLA